MAPGLALAVVLGSASPTAGTELNLSIVSQDVSRITVVPGATVPYQVLGELGDSGSSQGLAAFSFDLHFTGGPLAPLAPGSDPAVGRFLVPQGLTNPAGFGGTPVKGDLAQVGGAQNVIGNTGASAPAPTGQVLTGVGFTPLPLAAGALQAPAIEGEYQVLISNVRATVIRNSETGVPSWRVVPTQGGSLLPLTIVVIAGEFCGNGIVSQGEECDDGNFQDGDGCGSGCQLEELIVPTLGRSGLLLLVIGLLLVALWRLRSGAAGT